MKKFVVAFPLECSAQQAPLFIEEKLKVKVSLSSKNPVIVPGCPIFFTPVIQGPFAGMDSLFAEHSPLSPVEAKAIANHGSIFFLQFLAKIPEEFEAFLDVAKTIVESGALGVYVESSGCAWSAKTFLELIAGDVPMEAFLNFVETKDSLFTLGLEPFGLPDLCALLASADKDALRDILTAAADSVYSEGIDFASGAKWMDDNGKNFEFRKESKMPYAKGSPELNSLGYVRLISRS